MPIWFKVAYKDLAPHLASPHLAPPVQGALFLKLVPLQLHPQLQPAQLPPQYAWLKNKVHAIRAVKACGTCAVLSWSARRALGLALEQSKPKIPPLPAAVNRLHSLHGTPH